MQAVPAETAEAVTTIPECFSEHLYSAICHVNQQIGWAHSDRNMHAMW